MGNEKIEMSIKDLCPKSKAILFIIIPASENETSGPYIDLIDLYNQLKIRGLEIIAIPTSNFLQNGS